MARLRSRMLGPPFGYFYLEGNIKLTSHAFDETVKLMVAFRRSNGLPPGDPEADLERFTCDRWPDGCDFASGEARAAQRSIIEKGSDFLNIYTKWSAMGFNTVDQIEANRRSELCWRCPANKKVSTEIAQSGCCGRGKMMQVFESVSRKMAQALTWPAIKNKTTPADNELFTCEVCQCPNKVSVWVPIECYDYDAEMREKFRAANQQCWKLDKK